MGETQEYPPEAFAPDGTLWWKLQFHPGTQRPFGDEQKIAAYLATVIGSNATFTLRSLRVALGEGLVPNDAEHFNRRMRTLRTRDGWSIPSRLDDGSLAHDEYRVREVGWHPGTGLARPANPAPSTAMRRRVIERDRSTCQVCGIGAGEPYPDMAGRTARMTLGHRIPGRRADRSASADELQAECALCNEAVRDELHNPPTLVEVLPTVRLLPGRDKAQLLGWLQAGHRAVSRAEQSYADARRLSQVERSQLIEALQTMTADRA